MGHDARLRRWFLQYNRRYFGGGLPADTLILLEDTEGCYGQCHQDDDGLFTIKIGPRECGSDRNIAKATLLHEMAHIKLWPRTTHGPHFEREMQRLAAAGAFRGIW